MHTGLIHFAPFFNEFAIFRQYENLSQAQIYSGKC
jgi:hypothetical protein